MDRERVRLVDLEPRADTAELDTRLWATRFDRQWHTEQLQSRRQDSDWFAAVYHVDQLLERQPGDVNLRAQRQAIIAAAVKNDPKDATAHAAHARLLLEDGKLDDYRKTCAMLLDLAGDFKDEPVTRRLAAACVLAPAALEKLQPLLEAFKKTMSDKYPEDLRLYGGRARRRRRRPIWSGRVQREAIKRTRCTRTCCWPWPIGSCGSRRRRSRAWTGRSSYWIASRPPPPSTCRPPACRPCTPPSARSYPCCRTTTSAWPAGKAGSSCRCCAARR